MSVAIAYLRVSAEKQEVGAQRRVVEDFAKTKGFTALWFTDEAVSGGVKAFERPGFKRMIEFSDSNPRVKDIVVFELSKLGKDYNDLKRAALLKY